MSRFIYMFAVFISSVVVVGEVTGRIWDYRYDNGLADAFGVALTCGLIAGVLVAIAATALYDYLFK